MLPSWVKKAPGIRSGSAPPALRCHLADRPLDRDAAHGETVGDHANPKSVILALPSTEQRERWPGALDPFPERAAADVGSIGVAEGWHGAG